MIHRLILVLVGVLYCPAAALQAAEPGPIPSADVSKPASRSRELTRGWYITTDFITWQPLPAWTSGSEKRFGSVNSSPPLTPWFGTGRITLPNGHETSGAPEFHRLDAGTSLGPRWYLYYTASDGVNDAHHRLFVLESDHDDPLGPYHFKQRIQTDPKNEFYAIDGTVLAHPNGTLYFLWCGRPSSAGQGLYISAMSNPWTTVGPRVSIPADGFGCAAVSRGTGHSGPQWARFS